jgi:hypothetical protein
MVLSFLRKGGMGMVKVQRVKVLVALFLFAIFLQVLGFRAFAQEVPLPTRKQIDTFLGYALPPLMKGEMDKVWGLAPDLGYGPQEASCLYGPLATPPKEPPLATYSLARELAAVALTDLPGRGILRVYPPASLVDLRGEKFVFVLIDYRDFPQRVEFPAFAPPRPMGLLVKIEPAPAGQSFPWGSWCPKTVGGNPLARLDDTLYYHDFIARVQSYLELLARKIVR